MMNPKNPSDKFDSWIKKYGTPIWILKDNEIKKSVESMRRNYPNIDVDFSSKTIGWPQATKVLSKYFDGVTASCKDELAYLLKAGIPAASLIWWGSGKTTAEMTQHLSQGIGRIVLDNERELGTLLNIEINNQLNTTISIRIRAEKKSTPSGYQRFGIELDAAMDALITLRERGFSNIGIAYHADIMESNPEQWAMPRKQIYNKLKALMDNLENLHFDLGGGLPPLSLMGKESFNSFLDALNTYIDIPIKLMVCFGRAIVADAGFCLCRVVDIRELNDHRAIFVDVGSNLLIPLTSATFYAVSDVEGSKRPCKIYDTYSSYGIIDGDAILSTEISIGDLLIIKRTGAYTWSLRSSAIHRIGTGLLVADDGTILHELIE